MNFLLFVVIGLFMLTGCQNKKTEGHPVSSFHSRDFVGPPIASVSPDKVEGMQAYLTKDIRWSLPSAAIIKGSFTAVQSVRGHYGDKKFNVVVQLEKTGDELRLVGLSALGYKLFQIEYKAGVLTSELSFLVNKKIRPANLISDFLLTFGAEDLLQQALKIENLTFADAAGKRRVLQPNGQPIITISYSSSTDTADSWPETVNFHHDVLMYDIEIETLSREQL